MALRVPVHATRPGRAWGARRWRRLVGGGVGVLALALSAWGQSKPLLESGPLRIAWTSHAFLNMNRNDVEASFKALAQTVGHKRGYDVEVESRVFETAGEIVRAAQQENFHLLVADAWSYLDLPPQGVFTPRLTGSDDGALGKRYLLLVRSASPVQRLEDLRAKELVVYESANASLGRVWLDSVLVHRRLPGLTNFFGRVTGSGKSSGAVLPVFFGKVDACVVDQNGLEIMKEMNPAVGNGVRVVAASEALVDGFLCFGNVGWISVSAKEEFVQTLAELHEEPSGQQLLSLIKVKQLIPYAPAHLATVQALRSLREAPGKEGAP